MNENNLDFKQLDEQLNKDNIDNAFYFYDY